MTNRREVRREPILVRGRARLPGASTDCANFREADLPEDIYSRIDAYAGRLAVEISFPVDDLLDVDLEIAREFLLSAVVSAMIDVEISVRTALEDFARSNSGENARRSAKAA